MFLNSYEYLWQKDEDQSGTYLNADNANTGSSYQAPGRKQIDLPEGVDVTITTARSEVTSESVSGIRFFPDGGSTGGAAHRIGRQLWPGNALVEERVYH